MPAPREFRDAHGDALPDDHIRLRRYGLANGPAILVLGGISSGRVIAGPQGWWQEFIGPDAAIDTERFSVYGLDFAPLADRRIAITPRIQANLIGAALDHLRLLEFEAVIGASYGGVVGLALAASAPDRVRHLCVICAAHRPAPLALAWRGVQRRFVEFALEQRRGDDGLALARQLAMITYRSAEEFDQRFHLVLGRDGRSDLDRYLSARGEAYRDAMAVARWLSLSEALDRAIVTPEAVTVPTTLIACRDDQLVPLALVETLARSLPQCSALHAFSSMYGHDAFLKETALMSDLIASVLKESGHA